MNITLTDRQQAGLDYVTGLFNAQAEAALIQSQASLPSKEKTTFSPITSEEYFTARISDVADSYARSLDASEETEIIAAVRAMAPEDRAALKEQARSLTAVEVSAVRVK